MPRKSKSVAAVVLAAGKGTRMKSKLPKVLHPCCEVPLIVRVVGAAVERGYGPIVVVVGKESGRVRDVLAATFPKADLVYAVQKEQRGTGHATQVGLSAIPDFNGKVMTLYGDVPLLRPSTLAAVERSASKCELALLTAKVADPTGYGRVIRDRAQVLEIVEHKDASAEQRAIDEINVGVYCGDAALIREAVRGLKANNKQKELYLTDVVELAASRGKTRAVSVDAEEVRGINTRAELAEAEATLRRWLIADHQKKGVTFRDPGSVLLNDRVVLGPDVVVGPGVQFYGRVRVGAGARIEGPSVVKNAEIGPESVVESFSHVEEAMLARSVTVGPFARIRPGSDLREGSKVGNFVELKKTQLGRGAKANHLAYLGDASIGPHANVGAGTITCNYDGFAKHRTTIGKGAFVGSNSTLVAPVTVGADAYVAAGSTVTRDVPRDALGVGRSRQENKKGYAKRLRARLESKE